MSSGRRVALGIEKLALDCLNCICDRGQYSRKYPVFGPQDKSFDPAASCRSGKDGDFWLDSIQMYFREHFGW